jgi:DNA-binding CsgD family transcriptional regulator/tetratricopeptide (TPR) repeat protein
VRPCGSQAGLRAGEAAPSSSRLSPSTRRFAAARARKRRDAHGRRSRWARSGTKKAIGYQHAVNVLFMAGETDEAGASYELAIQHARRRGDPFALSNLLGVLAYVRLRAGRLLDAEDDLREGLELSHAAGPASTAFQCYAGTLAEVLIERGELDEAWAVVESTQTRRASPREHAALLPSGRSRQAAPASTRTRPGARRVPDHHWVSSVEDAFNPVWLPARSLAPIALHHLGRDDEAASLAAEELALARRWGAPVGIAVSLRTLGLVTGGADGLAKLAEAVDLLEPTSARLEYARACRPRWSAPALELEDRGTSAAPRGVEIARRLSALALVEHANNELAATGARPRKVMQTGLETLTASERRVAQLAADDMRNKEIAEALFVTVKTVEVHLSSTYRKLEISSRRQLAGTLVKLSDSPLA